MASRGNIYVVTMYRWGDVERHSYVLGVYDKKQTAIGAGAEEKADRGGDKYYPQCLEFAGFGKQGKGVKVVVELPIHPPKRNSEDG